MLVAIVWALAAVGVTVALVAYALRRKAASPQPLPSLAAIRRAEADHKLLLERRKRTDSATRAFIDEVEKLAADDAPRRADLLESSGN